VKPLLTLWITGDITRLVYATDLAWRCLSLLRSSKRQHEWNLSWIHTPRPLFCLWASPSPVLSSASLYYWTCMCAFTALKSERKWLFCWRHWHDAMDGPTQSYIFKQKLQHCKTIDLSRFVVDLRERHLEFGVLDTLFWKFIRERANTQLITNAVLFLPKGPWSLISLTFFPNTCFSTCLVMSSVVQLVLDFVFIPYVLRQRLESKLFPHLWPVWCW